MEYYEIYDREKNSFQKKSYFMLNKEGTSNYIRISNEINNYFVSVGSTKINHNSCNPYDYMQSNVKSMAIPNYNENDAPLVINYLNNSSPGWDNIPASIAKQVIHWYIKPLVFLINQSLIEGVFPDELKLAKIIPVYKAGSTMELFSSKFYEKLIIIVYNICIAPYNTLTRCCESYKLTVTLNYLEFIDETYVIEHVHSSVVSNKHRFR